MYTYIYIYILVYIGTTTRPAKPAAPPGYMSPSSEPSNKRACV